MMTELDPRSDDHKVASALFDEGRYEESFESYRKLAEGGSITAQLLVGWMYHSAKGVSQDLEQARWWYQKAGETNSPLAQYYLGTLYRTQKLYQQAIECFEMSASEDCMPAVFLLGVIYDSGEGVKIDKEKAYRFFERAANLGHLFAQRKIVRKMIKGDLGIMQIPRGFCMLAKIIWTVIRIGWKDPDSDRIRW